jgi:hypothetical protein
MSFYQKNKQTRTQFLSQLKEKMTKGESNFKRDSEDERFWRPELDKTGTGSAVIRFLPPQADDATPYVLLHTHGFQGTNGKWYIENCPTSINRECPACKGNNELWNSGREEDKTIARNRKRKMVYISNILVIKDPKHPENEGKVFLYKFGKKIFEKIKDLACPPAEFDTESINAFDPYEGANFKLRITKVDGFPNYDKSTFDTSGPLFNGNDDKIAGLESQLHSLGKVLDPAQFKSDEDLQKRFAAVVGGADASAKRAVVTDDDDLTEEVAPARRAPARTANAAPTAPARRTPVVAATDDDDDYFAKLAQDED